MNSTVLRQKIANTAYIRIIRPLNKNVSCRKTVSITNVAVFVSHSIMASDTSALKDFLTNEFVRKIRQPYELSIQKSRKEQLFV